MTVKKLYFLSYFLEIILSRIPSIFTIIFNDYQDQHKSCNSFMVDYSCKRLNHEPCFMNKLAKHRCIIKVFHSLYIDWLRNCSCICWTVLYCTYNFTLITYIMSQRQRQRRLQWRHLINFWTGAPSSPCSLTLCSLITKYTESNTNTNTMTQWQPVTIE